MRLNCHILMDELSERYSVEYFGSKATDLHLKRPEIYNIYKENEPLQKNRTYCLTAKQLPLITDIKNGALLIYVDETPLPEQYRHWYNSFIWIQAPGAEIISVFNQVQRIFDKYDDWEYQMQSILHSTANVQEMVDVCNQCMANPIVVIDASFRFLGYSRIIDQLDTLALYRPGPDGKISKQNILPYLTFQTQPHSTDNLYVSAPANFFIKEVRYQNRVLGNITVPFLLKPQRHSDFWILSVFADYISKALVYYENNPSTQTNLLRTAFQHLVSGTAMDSDMARTLNTYNGNYLCLRLAFSNRLPGQGPLSHLCSYVENTLPHAICFEHIDAMVAFLNISDGADKLLPLLLPLLTELGLYAGISYPFRNLTQARYYYQQAHAAMRLARTSGNEGRIYFFQNFALQFLLGNCTGGLPLETLYTQGFQNLISHDQNSKTSYLETLRVYLDNCMNIAKTASDLNIHRSSLIERLHYIESLLDGELTDPDYRLHMTILLKEYIKLH